MSEGEVERERVLALLKRVEEKAITGIASTFSPGDPSTFLDSLSRVHGEDVVIGACDIVDRGALTLLRSPTGPTLVEIQKKTGKLYTLFEGIHYCPCDFFADRVLEEQDHFLEGREECVTMVIWLNVAEKNDAAKNIAGLLSHGTAQRTEGQSVYNKVYKFPLDIRDRGKVDMVMTSVSGHLLQQDFGPEMAKWASVPCSDCFSAPIHTTCPQNSQPIMNTLQANARRASVLVLWTDCDREGEAIGFEVINVCSQANPRLDIYRARFSEITGAAVWRALNNLARPDARLNDAVLTRSELDLRTGAAFTRLQTLRLRANVPQLQNNGVLSYGSCQFPTLGFVVERFKSREAFVEEPFWKLRVSHTKNGVVSEFNWARNRLFQREAVQALLTMCRLAETAEVTSVREKPKSRWRPLPLDTVELEKLGVRKLHITAKQTLDAAERLYQKGFLSYPRTETNQFPPELNLANLVQAQANDQRYSAFANDVLQRGVNPRRGQKTDQAHPPIHPLKAGEGLNDLDARVFDLVTRHFLACVSRDATGSETIVDIQMGGEGFTATGLVILDRGYLDIYPFDQWNAKTVGHYRHQEVFRPDRVYIIDGHTSAPPLLTEADLITLMDKHGLLSNRLHFDIVSKMLVRLLGIGTDATHAQHIATIQERGYVGLSPEQRFVPGFLGLGLVDGYEALGYRMARPNLRAEFEADLKAIVEGRKSRRDVLRAYIAKYQDIFTAAEAQFQAVIAALRRHFGQAPAGAGGGAPGLPPPPPPPPNRGGARGRAPRRRGGGRGGQRRGGRGRP